MTYRIDANDSLICCPQELWQAIVGDKQTFADEGSDGAENFRRAAIEVTVDAPEVGNRYRVLGLSSCQCFFYEFSREDCKALLNPKAACYALEECIPLDASQMSIACLSHRGGMSVFVIDASCFVQIVSELEQSGCTVLAIVPVLSLALQSLALAKPAKRQRQVVAWQNHDCFDVVLLDQGKWVRWRWVSKRKEDVSEAINSLIDDSGQVNEVLLLTQCDETFHAITAGCAAEVRRLEWVDQMTCAQSTCQRIVEGRMQPTINLRRGILESGDPYRPIRKSIRFLTLAVAVCMITWITVCGFRIAEYHKISSESVAKQGSVFLEVFPGTAVPVGTHARLQSERLRLLKTRGVGPHAVPELKSVVPTLHAFMSAVPDKSRFSFERIELDSNFLKSAIGTAKTLEDAQTVNDRLRRAGFDVAPLSSVQSGSGFSIKYDSVKRKGH